MRRKNLKQFHPTIGLLFFAVILSFLSSGCENGNLRFNPVSPDENYALAGNISLSDPVESSLLTSFRRLNSDISVITDFSKFLLAAGVKSGYANKDASFRLERVPFSGDLLLSATLGKVVFLRRLYPVDLRMTDVSRLKIDIDSTSRALVWKKAKEQKIELTDADIGAREYSHLLASISSAIKLALQLPKKDVPKTILDLEMVLKPVNLAANTIEPREAILTEAHVTLQNAFLRKNLPLFGYYISTDFGNDWDSNSNYQDFINRISEVFKGNDVKIASYTILQMEFLPNNKARVRATGQISLTSKFSGLDSTTETYTSDVIWRKEGTFWKIHRNLPYQPGHPTQVGADARWGEIAGSHANLQVALFREDLPAFINLVSPNFSNDWDMNSTANDLLETARNRFNYS
ncbi:hypothetical protein HYY75_11050, partial [bacterium]|nr:hypothetical protein [bacterium]